MKLLFEPVQSIRGEKRINKEGEEKRESTERDEEEEEE